MEIEATIVKLDKSCSYVDGKAICFLGVSGEINMVDVSINGTIFRLAPIKGELYDQHGEFIGRVENARIVSPDRKTGRNSVGELLFPPAPRNSVDS